MGTDYLKNPGICKFRNYWDVFKCQKCDGISFSKIKMAFPISVLISLHKLCAIASIRLCIFANGQGFVIINACIIL